MWSTTRRAGVLSDDGDRGHRRHSARAPRLRKWSRFSAHRGAAAIARPSAHGVAPAIARPPLRALPLLSPQDATAFVRVAEERRFDGSDGDVGVHCLQMNGKAVPLLGGAQLSRRPWLLYVRAAGRALCNWITLIKSDQSKCSMDWYVVTGTPGTGKSAFANYFVARQLAVGKTIYFMFGTQGLVLEPSAGGRPPRATRYDKEFLPRFETLVQNADAEGSWCVLDAVQPSLSWRIPTLLVTSPREELYKEWLKQGKGEPYFMPLPSFEEICELSSALGTGMDDAALKERIKVGGYVFRYVADGSWTIEQLRRRADEAVGNPTLDRIRDFVRAAKRDTETSSRIVHVDVPRHATQGWRFAWPEYTFASDFVSELVYTRAQELVDEGTWWAMLNGHGGWPRIYNPLLFEDLAQRRLCRPGAQVRIRRVAGAATYEPARCEDDGSYLVTISARELELRKFVTVAELSSRDATLWIPDRPNFPAVDGVLLRADAATSFLLQCTATEGHRRDDWTTGAQMVPVVRELAELWRGKFGEAPMRVLYVVPYALWRDQKVTVTCPINVCVYVCRLEDGMPRV